MAIKNRAIAHAIENTINRRYTVEEREDLIARLVNVLWLIDQVELAITSQRTKYLLTSENFHSDEFILFFKPLEEMPLYINDRSDIKQTIAAWLLKCAK